MKEKVGIYVNLMYVIDRQTSYEAPFQEMDKEEFDEFEDAVITILNNKNTMFLRVGNTIFTKDNLVTVTFERCE